MSRESSPNRQETVVKARYFIPVETNEENLREIQLKLSKFLMREGFTQTDVNLDYSPVPRTMEFQRRVPEPDNASNSRVRGIFTRNNKKQRRELDRDEYLDGLSMLRDDLPFQFVVYFKSVQVDEEPGYDVAVESTPVLLQKFRQLDLPNDYSYNLQDVVEENKSEMQRIMGKFGIEPYSGPYTEAEIIEPKLSESQVEFLEQHEYGRNAASFINEGDQCFRQNLLHAAMSCYIHAIEWSILHYKVFQEQTDLIEKERKEGRYFTFDQLVDRIQSGTPASQKTIRKLRNINKAERRWAAHHKSGRVKRDDVETARSNLFRLIEDFCKP